MPKPNYLTFKIAPEDYARLAALANTKGYSISEMARKCLRFGFRFADDFAAKDTSGALRQNAA